MGITESLAAFGTHVIGSIGYVGVFLLMVAESMVLPVPSEAVMPFAGFVVAEETLGWAGVIASATLGSIVGSLIGYAIGKFGGRPFLERYGKYLLLDTDDLAATDRFFQRRGGVTILISRFIPIVRHLISIPAGMASMRLVPFFAFTIFGAGLWNTFLTACGFALKRNWTVVTRYSRWIDIGVVVLLAGLVVLYVARHLMKRRRRRHAAG
ncbi:MAG: DedA family protein [Spirochaetia bacterium]|jgi:membrane protein DedA with SNARE-associated domain